MVATASKAHTAGAFRAGARSHAGHAGQAGQAASNGSGEAGMKALAADMTARYAGRTILSLDG